MNQRRAFDPMKEMFLLAMSERAARRPDRCVICEKKAPGGRDDLPLCEGCQESCERNYNPIDLVMATCHVSFLDAVRDLRTIAARARLTAASEEPLRMVET